jgi:environmental stress-induced protein Ves
MSDMKAGLAVVPLDGIAPTPWKNGGGTTRDLLAWPDPAHWQLRISVAAIERDGPFSDFSGIDRWFTVLHGEGVALQLADQRREVRLGEPPLQFDGALAPMCSLLDGPTSDLNLMTRRNTGRSTMTVAKPGRDWVSYAPWRALVAVDGVELLVDGRVAAHSEGTALIWSPQAAGQRWELHASPGGDARAWWIAFHPLEATAR